MEQNSENNALFLKQPPRLMGLQTYFQEPPTNGTGTDFTPILKEVFNLRTATQSQVSVIQSASKSVDGLQKEIVLIRKSVANIEKSIANRNKLLVKQTKANREDTEALVNKLIRQIKPEKKPTNLNRTGSKIATGLKNETSKVVSGLLDTLFPGLGKTGITGLIGGAIAGALVGIGGKIATVVGTVVTKAFAPIVALLKTLISNIGTWLKTGASGAVAGAKKGTSKAGSALRSFGAGVATRAKNVGTSLKDFFVAPSKAVTADVLDASGKVVTTTTGKISGTSGLSKVIKGGAGKAGLIGAGLQVAMDVPDMIKASKEGKLGQQLAKTGSGVGGTAVGSVIGGAIGTAIAPGVGTVVGSMLGGAIGDWAGRSTAQAIISRREEAKENDAQLQVLNQMLDVQKQQLEAGTKDNKKDNKGVPFGKYLSGDSRFINMKYLGLKGAIPAENSMPFVAQESVRKLKELDTMLDSASIKFKYTSAMGGHTSGGHVKGKKVDLVTQNRVLTPEEYTALFNKGYFGGTTGAIGYEHVKGQNWVTTPKDYEKMWREGRVTMSGNNHYDLFTAESNFTTALNKATTGVNKFTESVTGFAGNLSPKITQLSEHAKAKNAEIEAKMSTMDARVASYGKTGNKFYEHQTQMEVERAYEKAYAEATKAGKTIKEYKPPQYGTEGMGAIRKYASTVPPDTDMTLMEIGQTMFQQ